MLADRQRHDTPIHLPGQSQTIPKLGMFAIFP